MGWGFSCLAYRLQFFLFDKDLVITSWWAPFLYQTLVSVRTHRIWPRLTKPLYWHMQTSKHIVVYIYIYNYIYIFEKCNPVVFWCHWNFQHFRCNFRDVFFYTKQPASRSIQISWARKSNRNGSRWTRKSRRALQVAFVSLTFLAPVWQVQVDSSRMHELGTLKKNNSPTGCENFTCFQSCGP